ncbi:hypothetical protein V7O66_04005 [Methanolobus sp. ZRKC3]|uniref:hypothetical protein n=1 Tax=Methanolobus sp. ZRKC3 TaxID=3125786 RepID=UPI00324FBB3A
MESDTVDASDENPRRTVIRTIFWSAVVASAVLIYLAVFKSDPIIPLYVIVFSLIGGLMYLFASTASEWGTRKKELTDEEDNEGDKLKQFNNKSFYDKLDDFDIQRKSLRVLAAPLMAIGIYLLFDLIFVDFDTTTVPPNISLENSTIQNVVNAIEAAGDSEKITLMKAGISFLAGAFVKQFLDLIQALAEGIGKKN